LAQAQHVSLNESGLGWWSFHLQGFLDYCRRRGDRVEARILARGYFDQLRLSEPPVASFRIDQTKQALTVFLRGTEHWHWAQTATGGWIPRFRLKSGHAAASDGRSSPSARGAASLRDRGDWERALHAALRVRHYAIRTEQTYAHWTRHFLEFHAAISLGDLSAAHVRGFLEHLAIGRNVTASTQNQALSALLFFFQHVLARELGELGETVRARTGRKLPIVLSREELRRLLAATEGTSGLMLRLLYGGGLRLMECVRLRVKDVDLERELTTVRSGKGNKDRTVPLPRSLSAELERHRERLRLLHAADRRLRLPGVWLPDALSVKYPRAGEEFASRPGWRPSLAFSPEPENTGEARHVPCRGSGFFPAAA
jgi:hypothetical protein